MPTPDEMYTILNSLVASGSLTIDSLYDYVVRHTATNLDQRLSLREHLHATLERNLMEVAGQEIRELDTTIPGEAERDETEREIFEIIKSLDERTEICPEGGFRMPSMEEFRRGFHQEFEVNETDEVHATVYGPVRFEVIEVDQDEGATFFDVRVHLVSNQGYNVASLYVAFTLPLEVAFAQAYECFRKLFSSNRLQCLAHELDFLNPGADVPLKEYVEKMGKGPKSALERIAEEA